jgi:hypothetical protein
MASSTGNGMAAARRARTVYCSDATSSTDKVRPISANSGISVSPAEGCSPPQIRACARLSRTKMHPFLDSAGLQIHGDRVTLLTDSGCSRSFSHRPFLKWEGEAPAEPYLPEKPARREARPPESPRSGTDCETPDRQGMNLGGPESEGLASESHDLRRCKSTAEPGSFRHEPDLHCPGRDGDLPAGPGVPAPGPLPARGG